MPRKKLKSETSSDKHLEDKPIDGDNSNDKKVESSPPVQAANNIFGPEGELVVDVFETNSDFVVLAAIAGVQIKDLDIAVEKDMMIIKGHRTNPIDNSDKKYFHQECYWGPFSKKIVLPENISTEEADAKMDKGVLTIKIPKIRNVKLS